MALWYIFVLLAVAAVLWVIWAHRKRRAQKAADSAARMRELLATAPRSAPQPAPAAAQPAQSPRRTEILRRTHLLEPPQVLLYQRLKAGLPDLEIFASVALCEVVQVGADAASGGAENQLAPLCIDFLVCERNSRIIAAVEFESPAPAARLKAECLSAAGIRHVRIHPKAIPPQHALHAMIFGAAR